MGLRDKLRKKADDEPAPAVQSRPAPEVTFIRSDTFTQEIIEPPSAGGYSQQDSSCLSPNSKPDSGSKPRRSFDVFRSSRSRSSSVSDSSHSHRSSSAGAPRKRLSQRLGLKRSPSTSENLPPDLPEIVMPEGAEHDKETAESQWEQRATILALENDKRRSRPGTPVHGAAPPILPQLRLDGEASAHEIPGTKTKAVSSKEIDEDIQEAIRLHEAGKLEESTALFARLADPKGANNPLSQVLYGLALRYAIITCWVIIFTISASTARSLDHDPV